MKIVSWNVNGIRSAWVHGLSKFLSEFDADIFCFQETKTIEPIHALELDGFYPCWSFCTNKKAYSGTFCLTRIKPLSYSHGLPNCSDNEGRVITLEFSDFYLINCYVPNIQHSYSRSDFRQEWDSLLLDYVLELKFKKPVIICGDFNVAVSNDDIYKESKWVDINSQGFQSVERESFLKLMEAGFVDSYRELHPAEKDKFTWWSNRKFKRKENRGWRLDYFLVDSLIFDKVKESEILSDVRGSDHCPIVLDVDLSCEELQSIDKKVSKRSRYTYSDVAFMGQHDFLKGSIHADMSSIWETIDWGLAEENLKRMQEALAKSAYSRDLSLIEKWQRKIVYSLDAKVLAVRHVCDAAATVGIDDIAWTTSHEKITAAFALNSKGYTAMPARILLIKCKNGKERRIHINTYYDRAMQTLYSYALDPVAESWADRKSFAFRKGRSTFDLNEYVKIGLSGEDSPDWVFVGDVKQCYESISHEWVKKNIPLPPNILEQFLKAGYVISGNLFPEDTGVAIGSTIAPIIANMVLDGLQGYIYDKLNNGRRVVYPIDDIDFAEGNLIRYADDIIITARSSESAEMFMQWTSEFLEERGLKLSKEKSIIVNARDGFDFMSRHYVKHSSNIVVYPSQRSINRFIGSINEVLECFTGSQQTLIKKINRKIDGWCSYHKVEESEDAFRHLDMVLKAALLELCKQKHPKWDVNKILEKYWYQDPDGMYCYALPERKDVRVKKLSDTILTTHKAVRTGTNPYIDFEYYEAREDFKAIQNVTGKYKAIWARQNGCCYYCGKPILCDDEKSVIEINGANKRRSSVFIHQRCADCSVDYVDVEDLPDTANDVAEIIKRMSLPQINISQKYICLYNYFRSSGDFVVRLSFKKIEEIIGSKLSRVAYTRKEFWFRRGLNTVSQCWLDNGYHITDVDLKGERVTFQIEVTNKRTINVDIPDCIANRRIPVEAKYELENFYEYLKKKYGL